MSGLEILGAVASSIALVQAVKGSLKAIDLLRQNFEMKKQCNNLRREIIMIECFIMQAQQQTAQQQLLGSAEHPLVSLATEELEDILNELNEIVERYSHSRKAHDPKRYTDKMKWFTEASKIEELCDRAQATKSNLHMAITFRVSSMVDRGNMRQEVLFHRVTQQLTSYTRESFNDQTSLTGIPEINSMIAYRPRIQELEEQGVVVSSGSNEEKFDAQGASPSGESNYTTLTTKEETFISVTTVQPLGTRTCSFACQCRCHRNQREYNGGAWAKSILGSWLVRYDSSSSACKGRCGTNTGVKLEYRLPKWLWAGVVSFEACQDPKLNLALRPRRVLETGHEVFQMIQHPQVLQDHIRKHKYFPDDIDGTGRTLLGVAISKETWVSVGILLKLWENILPHQELPRVIGFDFMRKHRDQRGPSDTLDAIREKLLFSIADWDSCVTDVHFAALNPEGTADEMLMALQKEPWAIDELDEYGRAPIHWAAEWGNLMILDVLIMAKANINLRSGIGNTPLVSSISAGRQKATKRLLEVEECRMHINSSDVGRFNLTALHYAIHQNSPAMVRMLLEAGAKVRVCGTFVPTLHVLAYFCNKDQDTVDEIFGLLLAHGADIEERDYNGHTPIMAAVSAENILVLRTLINAGASLTVLSPANENILHCTMGGVDVEMLDYVSRLDLTGVQVAQRTTDGDNMLGFLNRNCNLPPWEIDEFRPQLGPAVIEACTTFYFDLLIPELRSHMSTINDILRAVEARDASTATGLLDQLIEKNVKCGEPDLVGWYRGLKGYVFGGDWDHLANVVKEEYDETGEKIERAKIARGKTITDPEMEEFF